MPSGQGSVHKEKFYNPIFQNNTHIKYIKKLLNEDIPIHSIIFSERCEIINIAFNDSNINIIKRNHVYDIVRTIYDDNTNDNLFDEKIDEINNKLYPYTQVDEITKANHINSIINMKNDTGKEKFSILLSNEINQENKHIYTKY